MLSKLILFIERTKLKEMYDETLKNVNTVQRQNRNIMNTDQHNEVKSLKTSKYLVHHNKNKVGSHSVKKGGKKLLLSFTIQIENWEG